MKTVGQVLQEAIDKSQGAEKEFLIEARLRTSVRQMKHEADTKYILSLLSGEGEVVLDAQNVAVNCIGD